MLSRDRSRKARFWQIAAISLCSFVSPAFACEVPESEGSSPLRRLITRVKHLPETETWQRSLPDGAIAQFAVLVDSPRRIRGRCYWPVEVRASGELWKRFFVTADASHVVAE